MTGNICKGAYVLRFTEVADFQKVMDFCAATRHASVRSREPEVLKASVAGGAVLVLENPKGGIEGMIAAYPLVSKDEGGREVQKWAEVGSVRILLNGFPGLFETMTAMSVLRAHMLEPPGEAIISRVGHSSLQRRMVAMGWREIEIDPEAAKLSARTKRYEDDLPPVAGTAPLTPKWLAADPAQYPAMARQVCRLLDQPVLERADGKTRIGIDFSAAGFVRQFEGALRALAAQGGGMPSNGLQPGSKSKGKYKKNKGF